MGTNQLEARRPLDQFLIHFAMSELVMLVLRSRVSDFANKRCLISHGWDDLRNPKNRLIARVQDYRS
jgi:hypothetical protein